MRKAHRNHTFVPSLGFPPSTYRALGFLLYPALLLPSAGIVFAYPASTNQGTWWMFAWQTEEASSTEAQRTSEQGLKNSPFSCFRPLTVEKNLTAPQWPVRHQQGFQTSTLPLLIVFIRIKKEHHGFASPTQNKVTGRKDSVWNRKSHTSF